MRDGRFRFRSRMLRWFNGLQEILQNPQGNLLVALPDVFEDVSDFVPKSRDFWMEHMLFHRKDYERVCRKDRIYENAFFFAAVHYVSG